MSIFGNIQNITSLIGVNSDNVISGGNWIGDVYTGVGEQNDFSYMGVNLQTDENGTLTFEFSQDGTNWSNYPTEEFTIVSGINEVHGAWKGTRYIRVRFTGTGGRSFFRLRTMFSNQPIVLTAPLNQPIGSDQDATIVRAVSIGENAVGNFSNEKTDGIAFATNTNLGIAGVFDSGILNLSGYTQVQTHITSDVDGTMLFVFYSDEAGTDAVRALSIPYTGGSGFKLLSAPAFSPYIRYQYTNGGTAQSDFYFDTKFLTKSLSGQILGLDAFISPTMVSVLSRSVIVGQDSNGVYQNALVNRGNALVVGDFDTEVSLGNIDGYTLDSKFGYIENLPNTIVRGNSATWQDIWFQGGIRTVPTTSFTPFIASDDSSDTSIPISFKYLDASGDIQTGTTTLDGTDSQTPVSLGVTATELTRAWVTGTAEPSGAITITTANNFTSGTPDNQDEVLLAISSEDGQSQVCADRVPASTIRIIEAIDVHILCIGGNAGAIQAVFQTRTASEGIWRTRQPIFVNTSSPFQKNIEGVTLNAGDDFRIRIRDVSDADTYVSGNVKYRDITT